ncbi:MAG: hypothetical protein GX998_03105 [Firmicutes bacterium]|nr:hypothetical protein [Bacillota bacterium]
MRSVSGCSSLIAEHQEEAERKDRAVRNLFPNNTYVQRLLKKAESLDVLFLGSRVEEQWLYHPDYRTLCIWLPDLGDSSLSYLVVMLAHELGHVMDFDARPQYLEAIRGLPWFAVPSEIELSAFVSGYQIIRELCIPVTLAQYCQMIDQPMANLVSQVASGAWALSDAVCSLGEEPLIKAKQAG